MSIQSVLLPVFVLVGLAFCLLFTMGFMRVRAIRTGQVRPKDVVLGQNAWPDKVAQIGRAFQNQFELPLLFYVLAVLAIITKKDDLLFVVMEWIFVALRLAHAYIHCTSNPLLWRFQAFVAGAIVLTVMWIVFAVRILAPV